jgi:EmrB/QacA subfamily drug resistance transporter
MPVLLAGTALVVLDFFVVNVALPAMQSGLHASATALEWVVAGYGLTVAIFLMAAGRIGDRVGHRRVFTSGVVLFTLASAGCGLAPDANVLIAARLVQGVGAAMIGPTVLAIIGVLFAAAERPKAIGVYATVMGVAAAGGQLIGGLLLHADIAGLSWRLVFLVNVPVGIAALAFVRRTVPESRSGEASRFDVLGLSLLTVALTALVLPLVTAQSQGWSILEIATLAAVAPLFAIFVMHQRRTARRGGAPLLDPAAFGERSLRGGLVVQLGFWTGQASYFLVLALYLQLGRGLSPLASGLIFTILAAAYLATSMCTLAISARIGGAWTIVAGALSLAVGHLLTIVGAAGVAHSHSVLLLSPGLALQGVGMGLCIGPITMTVLGQVAPRHAGTASGVLSTVQQVAGALGVALIGLLFFHDARTRGYTHAFEACLVVLAALLAVVAVATLPLIGRSAAKSCHRA